MNDTPAAAERRSLLRAYSSSLDGRAAGEAVALAAEQAYHLTRVRRLTAGAAVELFDDAGRTARGELVAAADGWAVRLLAAPSEVSGRATTVYAAVPKGGRADWMVEKLSELGVGRFVPILCARGVVEPGGGKLGRFARLARESAKQSRRAGVMEIGPLTPLADALVEVAGVPAVVLSTERPGRSLLATEAQTAFVGPEGGWTPAELERFAAANVQAATLGETILRVETAAICCAAIWSARAAAGVGSRP